MNVTAAIAGFLTLIAFAIHAIVGGRELTIGLSDAIANERLVLSVVSGYFGLCGVSWLGTVLIAGHGIEWGFLKLSQWLVLPGDRGSGVLGPIARSPDWSFMLGVVISNFQDSPPKAGIS